ncbi:uncharacterized protein FA14DRAFT_107955, partial [Meira miltonrushii]
MVWGAVTIGYKSQLIRLKGKINAIRYCEEVIQEELHPFMIALQETTGNHYKSVEDNARIHNADHTNDYRALCQIDRAYHPPKSPDLNPIERVWAGIKEQ